jgi:hypothetical protein
MRSKTLTTAVPAALAGALAVSMAAFSGANATPVTYPTPPELLPYLPLTMSPSPMSITEGTTSPLTITFTNNLTQGIWINHINVLTTTNPLNCGDDCLTPFKISDSTSRLLNPGQSYTFQVPVVSPLDTDTGPETTKVSKSNIKTALWWEYNVPGRGQLQYSLVTNDTVNVLEPTASQVSPTTFGAAVPEPATWGLMLAGIGTVGATLRRRRLAAA